MSAETVGRSRTYIILYISVSPSTESLISPQLSLDIKHGPILHDTVSKEKEK